MKFTRLLAVCSMSATMVLTANSRPLDKIQSDGKIVIATEGQYYPFNYFQGSRLAGFEIELGEVIAKKMGLRVEWKALNFEALLVGLRQDRWDLVMASHGITDERAKVVTFADAHYCSGGVIISKDPEIRRAGDLSGRVVAVQAGSSYLTKAKELAYNAKEIRTFPLDAEARKSLEAGRADAWITDQFVALKSAASFKASGLYLGKFLFIERVAAAAAKGDDGLIRAWNSALAETLNDGSYAALSSKHFGGDIRCLQ